jgi:hypothetical protein
MAISPELIRSTLRSGQLANKSDDQQCETQKVANIIEMIAQNIYAF